MNNERPRPRYSVMYHSCPTGYGWHRDFGRKSEFKSMIHEARHTSSMELWVYDHKKDDFIFIKRGGTFNIEKDEVS